MLDLYYRNGVKVLIAHLDEMQENQEFTKAFITACRALFAKKAENRPIVIPIISGTLLSANTIDYLESTG
jgi:hypothetical protein